MEVKRIDWIDTLKGIGIFYVTFAHLNPALPIEKHIYSFHMFLFFFISGYLFRRKTDVPASMIIRKKAKALLLPFLFWDVVSFLPVALFGSAPSAEKLKDLFLIDGRIIWNAPIWFLLTLFLVETIFVAYDRWMPEQKAVRLLFPAVCLVMSYLIRSNIHLKLGIVPIAGFYYWLGYAVHQIDLTQKLRPYRYLWLALFLAVNLMASQLNERISVINCFYGSYKLCLIAGVTGVLSYMLFAEPIDRTKIADLLRYIGQRSMIIMCTQYYFFRAGTHFAVKFWGYDLWHERSTAKALIVSVVTIALILAAERLAKKMLPQSVNRIVGIQ